jgi:hypothetical protein
LPFSVCQGKLSQGHRAKRLTGTFKAFGFVYPALFKLEVTAFHTDTKHCSSRPEVFGTATSAQSRVCVQWVHLYYVGSAIFPPVPAYCCSLGLFMNLQSSRSALGNAPDGVKKKVFSSKPTNPVAS